MGAVFVLVCCLVLFLAPLTPRYKCQIRHSFTIHESVTLGQSVVLHSLRLPVAPQAFRYVRFVANERLVQAGDLVDVFDLRPSWLPASAIPQFAGKEFAGALLHDPPPSPTSVHLAPGSPEWLALKSGAPGTNLSAVPALASLALLGRPWNAWTVDDNLLWVYAHAGGDFARFGSIQLAQDAPHDVLIHARMAASNVVSVRPYQKTSFFVHILFSFSLALLAFYCCWCR